MSSTLTRYVPGSLKEVWALSWPLMLSSITLGFMLFTDRLLLAKVGSDTLNACAVASMLYLFLAMIPLSIGGISEVVVGRYNGASNYEEVGTAFAACFGLFILAFLAPFVLYAATPLLVLAIKNDLELSYFSSLLLFLPFQVLVAAFTGWYVGIGKVRIIIFSSLICVVTNILLDVYLIFGSFGIEPTGLFSLFKGCSIDPMGIKGAALATGFAQVVQAMFLGSYALKKTYRDTYHITHFGKHLKKIKKVIFEFFQLGFPLGLGQCVEILGHVCFMRLIQRMGSDQFTLSSLAQSIYFLVMFVGSSMNKTSATICANAIGSGELNVINRAIRNCLKLITLFSVFVFISTSLSYHLILKLFLNPYDALSILNNPLLAYEGKLTLTMFSLFLLFDNCLWVIGGVLTAKFDTKIIFYINLITYWGIVVGPLALLIYLGFNGVHYGWALLALSALVGSILAFYRHLKKPVAIENCKRSSE